MGSDRKRRRPYRDIEETTLYMERLFPADRSRAQAMLDREMDDVEGILHETVLEGLEEFSNDVRDAQTMIFMSINKYRESTYKNLVKKISSLFKKRPLRAIDNMHRNDDDDDDDDDDSASQDSDGNPISKRKRVKFNASELEHIRLIESRRSQTPGPEEAVSGQHEHEHEHEIVGGAPQRQSELSHIQASSHLP